MATSNQEKIIGLRFTLPALYNVQKYLYTQFVFVKDKFTFLFFLHYSLENPASTISRSWVQRQASADTHNS